MCFIFMLLLITVPGDIFQQALRWPTQTWGIQVFPIPAYPLLSAPPSGPTFTPTTAKAAKSPVPDLPVAPQDEAGLTKTFQTWPRGWFHIP